MKIFTCSACKHVAFFENSQCVSCGHRLAFLSDRRVLSALEQDASNAPDGSPYYSALDAAGAGTRYKLCKNYVQHGVCNWAIPEHDWSEYCLACCLNESVPDLTDPAALSAWQKLEVAKRRLVFTLLEFGLPLETKQQRADVGLAFSFKNDGTDGEKVLTGHCDGLVTINMKEANVIEREQTRVTLGERYRTLLGHFRHESGHYYWDRLVKGSPNLEGFRALFGNEEVDYAEAVSRHYSAPRQDWADDFVSSYATMHPWEDWAETWAHYLHMVDTLETSQSFGLAINPHPVGGANAAPIGAGFVRMGNFADLIEAWVPLTVALNSLNRSMGLPDLYPFVLANRVIEKLAFVHQVVTGEVARSHMQQSAEPEPTSDEARALEFAVQNVQNAPIPDVAPVSPS